MSQDRTSLRPVKGADRPLRERLTWFGEFVLVLLPTLTVLIVLAFVETLTTQRLLFASLASSAFLIYLDPLHGTNSIRTLVTSHLMASTLGLVTYTTIGAGYLSAGSAMVLTIILMVLLDVVHPPAVATSLGFALRAGDESNLVLFALAVAITAILIVLERAALLILSRYGQPYTDEPPADS